MTYCVERKPSVVVEIGEGVAVLRRCGVTRPVVAVILYQENDTSGQPCRLMLDRLVHKPHEQEFIGWQVSGAYASELLRATTSE